MSIAISKSKRNGVRGKEGASFTQYSKKKKAKIKKH